MNTWQVEPQAIFAASPVIPVMTIERQQDALPMAKALYQGGIPLFEITLRTPAALDSIRIIADATPDALIGAGTVLNCRQYDAAVEAGAQFVISPGMTPALLQHASEGPIPLIPGVSSPSEIMQALDMGYQYLKFFPAEANGGAKALAAMAAPLSHAVFCPTGGINANNALHYAAIPAVATVGGSWMLPKTHIEQQQWDAITALTQSAVALFK